MPSVHRSESPTSTVTKVPETLRSGDRMDQPEFHELYETTPHGFKAELIEGTVFVASPVTDDHSSIHGDLMLWAGTYRLHTPGVLMNDNGTVVLGSKNEPQPDAMLRIDPALGGRTRRVDNYVVGPPELAIEVAFSSRAVDLNAKYETYQAAGIQEYVVIDLRDLRVTWFVQSDGRYEPLAADGEGILRSPTFPGLWLDPEALVQSDVRRLIDTLQIGLASPEHAEFVARLAAGPGI